jgi:hypothetical protein
MEAQQADSWFQMVKKHKANAQGHLQRENAQLEHAEASCSHLARYLLEEFAFRGLSANQMQTNINDGKTGWLQEHNCAHIVKFRIKWQTLG